MFVWSLNSIKRMQALLLFHLFVLVQSLSCVRLCHPLDGSTHVLPSLSCAISQSLLKLMSVASVVLPNHLILCCPSHSALVFSSIRVLSHESALRILWPQLSFTFSINASNEYSGLSSFRIDGFDLLAVQGTLESLLQHHDLKAAILRCSAFFMVQLLYPKMTTGRTIALTRWTFVGKEMALLFKLLSRFIVASLVLTLSVYSERPSADCCL